MDSRFAWSYIRPAIALFIVLDLTVSGLVLIQPASAWPATSSGTENLTFYFHYSTSPPTVAGVSTNYIANTLANFQNLKNRDIKSTGQPKLQIDFYVYPPFADRVRLSGDWKAVVFVNSTALHPAGWTLEFWERDPNGTVVWDSSPLVPQVLGGPSGNNGKVDSPIFGYTLTASNLTHTFAGGHALEVEITVNSGATVPISLWYDSPHEPSKLILPSADHILVGGISTLDANGTLTNHFFTVWRLSQRNVTVHALVTDPFGGYDIYQVLVSVRSLHGSYSVANQTMQKVSGTQDSFGSSFSFTFNYSSHADLGNYTLVVLAIDNNAQNQFGSTSAYYPYAQIGYSGFSIGYQPVIETQPSTNWQGLIALVAIAVVVAAIIGYLLFTKRRKMERTPAT
jgi:hypothetical protein